MRIAVYVVKKTIGVVVFCTVWAGLGADGEFEWQL